MSFILSVLQTNLFYFEKICLNRNYTVFVAMISDNFQKYPRWRENADAIMTQKMKTFTADPVMLL